MLRFIIKVKWRDGISGAEGEYLRSFDIDVPELQDALTDGGFGENGYEMPSLVGVEVLRNGKEQQS